MTKDLINIEIMIESNLKYLKYPLDTLRIIFYAIIIMQQT